MFFWVWAHKNFTSAENAFLKRALNNAKMGHHKCLTVHQWAWAPPFLISKLELPYDKYSVEKVWIKIYCHYCFGGITLIRPTTILPCYQQINLTWARDLIGKPTLGQQSTSWNHVTSMSCKLEPTIWSRGTSQRIACFDRCRLIIEGCPISKKYTVN